jgi:putative acetyltransferase
MISIQTYKNVADTDAIVDLILNIQQNEFQVPITISDQPDLFIIDTYYQQGGGEFWLAKYQEELVGTIALINCGGGVGTIRKMFVKKEFRGKEHQIAQRLFDALQEFAKAKNIKFLYLGTIERLQAAIKFYEKNGFTLLPKENLPDSFPIMQVDTHFFEKSIA